MIFLYYFLNIILIVLITISVNFEISLKKTKKNNNIFDFFKQ